MNTSATRLTLIAAVRPQDDPADRLAHDGPAHETACARIGQRPPLWPDRMQVHCSPARAAIDTAQALGSVRPMLDDELRDRDQGAWGDRSLASLAESEPASFALWLNDSRFAPPGGESVADLVTRASHWLDERCAPASVLAVTHPALIRSFVVAALACGLAAWFRIDIGQGTRTILTRNGATWRVACVNTAV